MLACVHSCLLAVCVVIATETVITLGIRFPENLQCANGGYRKYSECGCGTEYAVTERRKNIPLYDIGNYFYYWNENYKKRFYYCRSCSFCDDGIPTIAPCWENQDTICGEYCEDVDKYYDIGTKSCQLKSLLKPQRGSAVFASLSETTESPKVENKVHFKDEVTNVTPEYGAFTALSTADDTARSQRYHGNESIAMMTVTAVLFAVMIILAVITLSIACRRLRRNTKQLNKPEREAENIEMMP
ncbi:uncharacterized protein LOC100374740 [Saccoglossus kowalevskii]|uniref:Uncharacterized protein LOC100374740 n=1 Tax=Saccoglossus kowalevskii TaxID=10224 RepID=A0ABM0GW37_SACKO|nr:PREDICTED: uncharacterized protein LOC100374740 [Saccoglossus kowalevskii]